MQAKPLQPAITLLLAALSALALLCTSCHEAKNNQPQQPDTVAYGPIRFGISEADYDKKFKDTLFIMEYSQFIPDALFIPKDKRLCRLRLYSTEHEFKDFEVSLKRDVTILTDEFIRQYGNPSRYFKHFTARDLENNDVGWLCEWNSTNKLIRIGITRRDKEFKNYYGPTLNKYIAVCEITHKPLEKIFNSQVIYLGVPMPRSF